jgi:hypothetical protein
MNFYYISLDTLMRPWKNTVDVNDIKSAMKIDIFTNMKLFSNKKKHLSGCIDTARLFVSISI